MIWPVTYSLIETLNSMAAIDTGVSSKSEGRGAGESPRDQGLLPVKFLAMRSQHGSTCSF